MSASALAPDTWGLFHPILPPHFYLWLFGHTCSQFFSLKYLSVSFRPACKTLTITTVFSVCIPLFNLGSELALPVGSVTRLHRGRTVCGLARGSSSRLTGQREGLARSADPGPSFGMGLRCLVGYVDTRTVALFPSLVLSVLLCFHCMRNLI